MSEIRMTREAFWQKFGWWPEAVDGYSFYNIDGTCTSTILFVEDHARDAEIDWLEHLYGLPSEQ